MKTKVQLLEKLIAMAIICAMVVISGCTKDPVMDSSTFFSQDESIQKSGNILTEGEIASLMFMVEEEKLALDVYTEMFGLYGFKIFDRISQSEFRHVSALSKLFEKYTLENPIIGNLPGVFVNEDIQQLYNDLIALGNESRVQALNVGIAIEEKDIEDIQAYLDLVVESKDLEKVYNNLLDGSGNHLDAFEGELASGVAGVPSY